MFQVYFWHSLEIDDEQDPVFFDFIPQSPLHTQKEIHFAGFNMFLYPPPHTFLVASWISF